MSSRDLNVRYLEVKPVDTTKPSFVSYGPSIFNSNVTINSNINIASHLSITGNVAIGGNTTIDGDLTVNGTMTTINSVTTVITDPILEIGTGPDTNKDRGIAFIYDTVKTGFMGYFQLDLVNPHISNVFIFKTDATIESNVVVSGSNANVVCGNVKVDKGIYFTNDFDDTKEYIDGDGTDLYLWSGNDINLNSSNVNINSNLIINGTTTTINSLNTIINGDLTVNGTMTSINSVTTVIKDPILEIGTDNDDKDRGIVFNYYETGYTGPQQQGFMGYLQEGNNHISNVFIFQTNASITSNVVSSGSNANVVCGNIKVDKGIYFTNDFNDSKEYIDGDGTDLYLWSSNNINLNPNSNINIQSGKFLNFGNDNQFIVGNTTDLIVSSSSNITLYTPNSNVNIVGNTVNLLSSSNVNVQCNNMNLQPTSNVNIFSNVTITANKFLTFGDITENIKGDSNDLIVSSGRDIKLEPTANVTITANKFLTFGDITENIKGDSDDLIVSSGRDIKLEPTANVTITANKFLTFGDITENIKGDTNDLIVSSGRDIILDPTSNINLNSTNIVLSNNSNIIVSTINGSTFGTASDQKLSFYGATPTSQYTSNGEVAGYGGIISGASNVVVNETTFTGNVGGITAKAYTINDIVKALKQIGILDT